MGRQTDDQHRHQQQHQQQQASRRTWSAGFFKQIFTTSTSSAAHSSGSRQPTSPSTTTTSATVVSNGSGSGSGGPSGQPKILIRTPSTPRSQQQLPYPETELHAPTSPDRSHHESTLTATAVAAVGEGFEKLRGVLVHRTKSMLSVRNQQRATSPTGGYMVNSEGGLLAPDTADAYSRDHIRRLETFAAAADNMTNPEPSEVRRLMRMMSDPSNSAAAAAAASRTVPATAPTTDAPVATVTHPSRSASPIDRAMIPSPSFGSPPLQQPILSSVPVGQRRQKQQQQQQQQPPSRPVSQYGSYAMQSVLLSAIPGYDSIPALPSPDAPSIASTSSRISFIQSTTTTTTVTGQQQQQQQQQYLQQQYQQQLRGKASQHTLSQPSSATSSDLPPEAAQLRPRKSAKQLISTILSRKPSTVSQRSGGARNATNPGRSPSIFASNASNSGSGEVTPLTGTFPTSTARGSAKERGALGIFVDHRDIGLVEQDSRSRPASIASDLGSIYGAHRGGRYSGENGSDSEYDGFNTDIGSDGDDDDDDDGNGRNSYQLDRLVWDKYGFRKGNNVISAQDQTMYELAYEPIIARRRGRWRKLISTSHGNLPPRSKKLKRFVRKGIPPEFRGMCWLRYSGAEAKMLKSRGIYDDIVNRLEQRRVETGQVSEAEELIGRDLHRTFPHNSHFRLRLEERRQALGGRQHAQQHSVGSNTGSVNGEQEHDLFDTLSPILEARLTISPGQSASSTTVVSQQLATAPEGSKAATATTTAAATTTSIMNNDVRSATDDVPALASLRRVLLAFVETRVEIGYHQALSYIAALLLLFVDEEPAYWMLLTIVDDILPPHYFDRRQEGSVVDQQIMFELIRQRLPALWRHFNRDTPQSALPNQSSSLIPQQLLSGGGLLSPITSKQRRQQHQSNRQSYYSAVDEPPILPTVSMAMSHWMPTLFVDVFPVETVLRIWDCLFCEVESTAAAAGEHDGTGLRSLSSLSSGGDRGDRGNSGGGPAAVNNAVLFRVVLALLRRSEPRLLALADPMELFTAVQNLPKQMIDCHGLLDDAHSRKNAVAKAAVLSLRRSYTAAAAAR